MTEILNNFNSVYAEALKSISQGVVIANGSQEIVYVNDAFINITGYSQEEIIGKNCRFLQGPLTDKVVVASIHQQLAERKDFTGEILNYKKDGTTFWNELTISPVSDVPHVITHFVGVIRDISIRKTLEEKNRMHIAELEKINNFMIDREVKMSEMKEEIARLNEILSK